ncbi:MAG: hypothetical protein BWY74_00061 [Firmicutes bacterium ADurb.Bin419]|nr:MAG: hypothetical protein BWY74_00061 [Firmicutes bacterium ADurb.Bin419]
MNNGLCGNNCNTCILKNVCGGCSFCEASICQRNCNRCSATCFIRDPFHTKLYFTSIGGPEIDLRKNRAIDLPAHIPILPDKLQNTPDYEVIPFIAVHGEKLLANNGEKINHRYLDKGYSGALNLNPDTKAILEFYVKDRTLEGFWDNRKSIYKDLKKLNFSSVISLNFSVFEDAPRADHLQNIKRSSIVYNELLDAGISAIPDIAWYNINDLKRWAAAINAANIKMIAFSFQTVDVGLKTSNAWKSYLLGFRYLCQNISSDIKILVAGIATPFKVYELHKASQGQSIHILNNSAYIQARRGMRSESRIQDKGLTFEELFHENIKYFNMAYSDPIFSEIMSWDRNKLVSFYNDYQLQSRSIESKYNIPKEKFETAYNLVLRSIKKKKVRI